ncbi:uncharacterized protein LY89DRAFT_594836 [Mollisia scopiformis]|uniref:Zn(2)-C6 fungal-type domain-containing protein n=1 Tax=Mollisia scopiformis TaxID=149040 RepID=A0A194WTE8_MOLSC|nr:uncharacterized protein LY89DRAFT_594836 [Mollisia scopiformis]KUJ11238.1 hypothetical protein LY89DRAFT_594836 [Mollisia scopiformis]
MSAQDGDTSSRKQRRAPMACEFCRRRKMRCNNEKPTCRNCKEHGRDCIYYELEKKPRPSVARISQLEHENRELQNEVLTLRQRLRNTHDSSTTCSVSGNHQSPILALGNGSSEGPSMTCRRSLALLNRPRDHNPVRASRVCSTSERAFSPDKDSCYHGPTSAVFDEKSTEAAIRQGSATVTKVSDLWIKRQLVAESANQRQLETVNFLAGKLDFDGIDPELGMHLLSIYWSRQQSSGPVVYRPAFMRDMACVGPYFSKLLLNAIYFYACKYTSRVEVRHDASNQLTAGWAFRQRVVELLRNSFDKSDIPTIQALLLLSSALFSWCDEKSVSWLYAGIAFSMIIDLGLNVDAGAATSQRRFSVEESEIRRRVFWAAYVNDKLQSLSQGRPALLADSGTSLPLSFLDDHDELELFNALSYTENSASLMTPVYSISTFAEFCKLSIILDKILSNFYMEKSSSRDPTDLLNASKSLHAELENWRRSLPTHLDIKIADRARIKLPHFLSLLAFFNVIVILLHRPFVSDGHLQSTSSSNALHAFSICSVAAFEIDRILESYKQNYCFGTSPHIISYATYVSATIHVRIAAQRPRGSDAHCALRRCLDILDIQQSVCWSPRRAKKVIDALISRMGVVLDHGEFAGSFESISSNINIDAIIRTFEREQCIPETQTVPFDNGEVTALHLNSTLRTPDDPINPSIGLEMPANVGDMSFLYDPIFGFNGSAFDDLDDLDFEFESPFL